MTLYRSPRLSRRHLLQSGAAAGLVGTLAPGLSRAQGAFPTRNMNVVIATGRGGGAETTGRAFADVLRHKWGVDFEFEFHPGAGGQVAYELFVHRRERDGYNLLYSNMHPEIITFATQNTNYALPDDVTHFARTVGSPIAVYVGSESPIQSIEQLVEEGRRRTVTISTSRLPHPGTIGMLALADATGADFNLVPFGGGNPTSMAAITGEVDAAVLTASVAVSLRDQVRTIALFREAPALAERLGNPPTVNAALDLDLPELELSSGWAVHTEVWENMPEVRETLESSIRATFDDPRLRENLEAVGYPWESVEYGGPDVTAAIVRDTIEFARRFADRLREA